MSEAGELVRHQPSGKVGAALAIALPAALAAAAAAGAGYQWILDHNPYVVLNVALPAVLGLVLGFAGIFALIAGKVRCRRVTWSIALVLAATGYGVAWLASLGFWGADFPGLAAAFDRVFRSGDPLPGQGGTTVAPGLLVMCWAFEVFLVALCAIAVPVSWWSRAVFCETGGRFVRREKVGVAYGPSPFAFRQAAQDKGLAGLRELTLRPLPENEQEGELRFYVHRAADATYMTVLWHGKLDSPRGRPVTREVLVLRRVRVEQAFLDDLVPPESRATA